MADIQLQIQDIIEQADVVNNQLLDIKTILLHIEKIHKIQVGENILEKLYNIIHGDMKRQA